MGSQDMVEKWTAFCINEEEAQAILDKAVAKSAGKFRVVSAKKEFMDKRCINGHHVFDKSTNIELRPYKFTISLAFLDK